MKTNKDACSLACNELGVDILVVMKRGITRTIHSNILVARAPYMVELVQPNYDVNDSSSSFRMGDSSFTDTWPVSCYLF